MRFYILDSHGGKDIRKYNSDEAEVLYQRNSRFRIVNKIKKLNGPYIIFIREQ